jgi:phage tail protein X
LLVDALRKLLCAGLPTPHQRELGSIVKTSRLFLAFGVILFGLCAALPFRLPPPIAQDPTPPAAPMSLTLRRPDAPLELAPRIEISPAVGLGTHSFAANSPSSQNLDRASQNSDLANLVPPPALPVSFQPTNSEPPRDWKPDPLSHPAPTPRPRPYRLRDGDTLEKIAERLLGDRSRAAEIYEANRNLIPQPDLLPIGVTIILPPRKSTSDLEPVAPAR